MIECITRGKNDKNLSFSPNQLWVRIHKENSPGVVTFPSTLCQCSCCNFGVLPVKVYLRIGDMLSHPLLKDLIVPLQVAFVKLCK